MLGDYLHLTVTLLLVYCLLVSCVVFHSRDNVRDRPSATVSNIAVGMPVAIAHVLDIAAGETLGSTTGATALQTSNAPEQATESPM